MNIIRSSSLKQLFFQLPLVHGQVQTKQKLVYPFAGHNTTITSLQWRENCIFETIISGSGMRACHLVAIVVWGTVRGVPSIIILPSPVKAAFSPLMAVLFVNLNLCKAPQKKMIMNWSIPKGKSQYTLASSLCSEVQVEVSEVTKPLATQMDLSDGPLKGKSSINIWRENASCSGQQKPTQTERELSVETKTVWVLGSSPEGICNHLSSLTVIFLSKK